MTCSVFFQVVKNLFKNLLFQLKIAEDNAKQAEERAENLSIKVLSILYYIFTMFFISSIH